jgi:mono/diheme cytochrome c family protein
MVPIAYRLIPALGSRFKSRRRPTEVRRQALLAHPGCISRMGWAILFTLWSYTVIAGAGKSQPPRGAHADVASSVSSSSATSAEMARAKTLFHRNCQSCHGQDGSGARARKSMPEIPDFTNPDWHVTKSEFALVASIREGKGTFMPAFADRLTDPEIRQLVAYVRALDPPADATKPAPSPSAAKTSANDFDRRFRELREEMKTLRAQFKELSR